MLYLGTSQLDITPALGTIIGVDLLPNYVRNIHDPLFVKSIYLNDGQLALLIIVVETCIMDTVFMDEVKHDIKKAIQLEAHQILLSANHNHATACTIDLLGCHADLPYCTFLKQRIVESAVAASQKSTLVKMCHGSVQAPEYVVCRRYNMKTEFHNPVFRKAEKLKMNPGGSEADIVDRASKPDPEVCYMGFKDAENKWVCVLANYGLHYAADWPEDTITGDYFGVFANKLGEFLDTSTDFMAVMSNGCSGEINIWDFLEPDRLPTEHYQRSKLIGEEIAKRVAQDIEQSQLKENIKLDSLMNQIELNLRPIADADLKKAEESFVSTSFSDLRNDPDFIQKIYDREQVLLKQYDKKQKLDIQVIKVGELIMAGMPGEFFAETGLQLKASFGSNPFFGIALSNSYGGYIPPAHEIKKGGYETWRARSSRMEEAAESIVRSKIEELGQKLIQA